MNEDSSLELVRELKEVKGKLASLDKKHEALLARHESFRNEITSALFGSAQGAKLTIELLSEIGTLKRLSQKCSSPSSASPYQPIGIKRRRLL